MSSTIAHPMVIALLDPVIAFLQSLAYIGENSHIVKLDYIDSKIQPIADSLSVGLPLLKVQILAISHLQSHHHHPNQHFKTTPSFLTDTDVFPTFIFCLYQISTVHSFAVLGLPLCRLVACPAWETFETFGLHVGRIVLGPMGVRSRLDPLTRLVPGDLSHLRRGAAEVLSGAGVGVGDGLHDGIPCVPDVCVVLEWHI